MLRKIRTKKDALAEMLIVQTDLYPRRISYRTLDLVIEALKLETPCDLCRFKDKQAIFCADCPAERRDEDEHERFDIQL